MISVAVVGIEGSGKTVLATMLAKRYCERRAGAPFFEAMSINTVRLVEKCWGTLQNREWPPSTPIGEMSALHWRVHFSDSQVCDLKMIDAAGQDLRQLFGEQRINDFDALPQHLKNLADCICNANIVLLLVNLGDICGVPDSLRRQENEFAAKFIIEYLQAKRTANPPRICLVLTQRDLHRGIFRQFTDERQLVRHHLPSLFTAHFASGEVGVLSVSAVANTDIELGEGQRIRRVPAVPVQSQGLSKLISWLQEAVNRQPPAAQVQTEIPVQDTFWTRMRSHVGTYLAMSVCIGVFTYAKAKPPKPAWPRLPPVTRPVPQFVTQHSIGRSGVLDDSVTSYGTVQNKGAAGKIRVISQVVEDGVVKDRKFQDLILNPMEVGRFEIELPGIENLKHKFEVTNEAVVP